jgi:2-aminoadipate transaminase
MFAKRMQRVTPSAIMELIKTTAAGDFISFASGLPDPALFPVELLREITDDVLARDGRGALQYGAAEGYAPLRELVAGILRHRSLEATPEHVLITTGSQQAIDLAARALLDPGDRVLIETPSYLAAIQTFDSYEVQYQPLETDAEGIVPERLPEDPGGAKLLYVLPTFQNPTGHTMYRRGREAVAAYVDRHGLAVLEDDAYHDLRYEGIPQPPICALTRSPWTIYTGTFSKVIAPGLRVGYLCAQPELVARLAQLKQITDLHSGSLSQRVVHEYCVRGYLEPGIQLFRSTYTARLTAMLEALQAEMPDRVEWTRPEGGMFVWMMLPRGIDVDALLRQAMERGVVFVPGATFHPDGRGQHTLRLNFVSADEERIRRGIAILGELLRGTIAGS